MTKELKVTTLYGTGFGRDNVTNVHGSPGDSLSKAEFHKTIKKLDASIAALSAQVESALAATPAEPEHSPSTDSADRRQRLAELLAQLAAMATSADTIRAAARHFWP